MNILYEVVCLSQSSPDINELFNYLFKDFASEPECLEYIENFARIGSHGFLPLSKDLEKVILVALEAHNHSFIDLKRGTKFSSLLKNISAI